MIINIINPQSVVDVGCGIGTWLKVFEENGVYDVLGIDGSYIDKEKFLINKEKFLPKDLSLPLSLLNRKFDMAMSLEVAEHINKKNADIFIKNLVDLSDVVVFSAAVPGQGGTSHLNEQWPSYWKNIFNQYGYEMLDPIRHQIVCIDEVEWWYKQNILIAVNKKIVNEQRFKNLMKFNEDFITVYKNVLKRNILSLRILGIIKKYILKSE